MPVICFEIGFPADINIYITFAFRLENKKKYKKIYSLCIVVADRCLHRYCPFYIFQKKIMQTPRSMPN